MCVSVAKCRGAGTREAVPEAQWSGIQTRDLLAYALHLKTRRFFVLSIRIQERRDAIVLFHGSIHPAFADDDIEGSLLQDYVDKKKAGKSPAFFFAFSS